MKGDYASCILLLVLLLTSCAGTKPFYNSKEKDWDEKKKSGVPVKYSVYLLGEQGKQIPAEVLDLVYSSIDKNDSAHAVVYFTDHGTSHHSKKDASAASLELKTKLPYLENDKGKTIFVLNPNSGTKHLISLKSYIQDSLKASNIFVTSPGCPGVDEIALTDDLVAVPLSPLPWDRDRDKHFNECDIENEPEWISEIKDLADNNQRKNILLLNYYPLMSLGNYGGHFSLRQHLFPLTDLHRSLYIPLPVIGSVYQNLRAGVGFKNDLSYPPYKNMRKSFLKAIDGYNNVVYASGHERNFQYFKYNKQDFIITNSSPKPTWTGRKNKAWFTASATGFVKLSYLQNGEVWLEVIVADKDSRSGKIVYRKQLKDNVYGKRDDSTLITSSSQIKDSTIFIAADKSVKAGAFKKFWLGSHYRNAWTTPVQVPVIDLRKEKTGLEIIKKGGGFQTKSLQLQNKKGEEYSLRSVVKYPERLLGTVMLHTFAADLVRDQVSSTHPYSPYVVDDLSEAAGILHSNPKMVFIPNDSLLAEYRKDFANTLALFEQRADGKMRPAGNFGYSRESVSSAKMLKKLHEDNANAVDDKLFLKSRLFDMWINDWDRHENQWRWGEIDCDSSSAARCATLKATDKIYVPIPKDRDQAFAKFDGVIPWLAGRKWAVRKFQDFQDDIRDVPGLNFNARNIDHALLTELSREDWMKIANELKEELTDKKIEHAIHQFPDTIFQLDGPVIIHRLKARRDRLPTFAKRYYDYLAKYVDVLGSDKKELFEVTRINNDSTSVNVFDLSSTDKRLIYSRTFLTNETNEVRLYGFGGDDEFRITGKVKKGILIRVIGGDGADVITDESHVGGWCDKTKYYDDYKNNTVSLGSEGRDKRSDSKSINEYDFYANNYNVIAPATFFGYNRDAGIFAGGGVMFRYNAFRKRPYANYQRIVANIAVRDLSFNLNYTGDFNDVFGIWGVNITGNVIAPKGASNFFGLGNETVRTVTADKYYRLRYDEVNLFPSLKRHLGKFNSFKIGPAYQYIRIRNVPGGYIGSPEGGTYLQDDKAHNYAGAKLEYEFKEVDDSVLSFRGIRWTTGVVSRYDIDKSSPEATNIESQFIAYIPVGGKSTLAVRLGGAHQLGNFEFYHANILGGQDIKRETGNLRGYLQGRFSGRSLAYMNADLRIKLFGFRTYLFPAHFGVLGFYDQGRVWSDGEKSNTWHSGYGGGIWMDPFALAVINFTYAVSKEDKLFTIGIGFLF